MSLKFLKNKIKLFSLELSDFQDFDAREKNNVFSVENSSTGAVFSIDNLLEKIERVVPENQKFEYRVKRKKDTFWNVWTVTNPMLGSKQKVR